MEDPGMIPDSSWQRVTLPHFTPASESRSFSWYRKSFPVGDQLKSKRIFIRFEEIHGSSEIFINGTKTGNGNPFPLVTCLEITGYLLPGKPNRVMIRTEQSSGKKGSALDPVKCDRSGIAGSVSLVITNKVNISLLENASSGVYVFQKSAGDSAAELVITTKIENRSSRKRVVEIRALLFDKRNFIAMNIKKAELDTSGVIPVIQNLSFNMPGLWDGRKRPFLHKLIVEIKENGKIIDRVTQSIGIRTSLVNERNQLILNKKIHPVYGVIYPAITNEEYSTGCFDRHQVRRNLETIYISGATAVWLPDYLQSAFTYDVCDSLGLMVWAEINKGISSKDDYGALICSIRQNYNHPSLLFYTLQETPVRPDRSNPGTADNGNTEKLAGLLKMEDCSPDQAGMTTGWWIPFDSVDMARNPDLHAWYRARWSDQPFIHINGKDDAMHERTLQQITVICNLLDPVLELNGRRLPDRENGNSEVEYHWKNIELNQGSNHFRAFAKKWGKLIGDSCTFVVK